MSASISCMIQGVKVCPACSREYGDDQYACPTDGVALIAIDTDAGERGENLIGQVVGGRYRLERVVGRGGMGTVYACRHVVVGKTFAMKVLRPGIERSEEILHRFIREAQAANSIGSRHICEVTDFGQLDNGAFYVVMELIEGTSMTKALREKQLSHDEIRHVFIQIADTLQKAHERGIIHRDLKPDNVLLVYDEGDPNFAKLLDFGIAKVMQAEASNLTETGVILGTPYYMSPEQARGDPVDHRSDIYALGVMMYRAFTGRLPFMADTAMGVLTRHLTEVPEAPSSIGDVDPATERVILRCMEKKPIERFQSMANVADALKAAAERPPVSKSRPTVDENTGRALRAALDQRLAAEGITGSSVSAKVESWGPGGPPSDAMQTTPRGVAVADPAGAAQPHFSRAPGGPAAPSTPPAAISSPILMASSPPQPAAQKPSAPADSADQRPAVTTTDGGPAAVAPTPQPGAIPPDGAGRDLQVEAFTARGLVSPTLEPTGGTQASKRMVLWAGAVVAMMLLGGASAFVLLQPTGVPPTDQAAPAASELTTSEPTADNTGDDPEPPEPASTLAESGDEGGGAPADVASADTTTAAPTPVRPPVRPPTAGTQAPHPPPAKPKATAEPTATKTSRPEIRSPFE